VGRVLFIGLQKGTKENQWEWAVRINRHTGQPVQPSISSLYSPLRAALLHPARWQKARWVLRHSPVVPARRGGPYSGAPVSRRSSIPRVGPPFCSWHSGSGWPAWISGRRKGTPRLERRPAPPVETSDRGLRDLGRQGLIATLSAGQDHNRTELL
jgi:hypothetical protein